ncbi:thioredoxin family protein [Flavobacterium sp.]|jgi:thioredoxin-related protein|uniref:thioredoxin family protein n=1 Tax=Flavobacterium sp. TaxID=239 RepID=UPI0037BEB3B6
MKKVLFLLFLFSNTILLAQNWQTSFEEAKSKAIKENKNIVLVFSGSDWFAPCMKFEKNVFNSNVFQTEAEKNWVIYKADFPEKKANQLNPELTEQNKKLAEKYNQNGSFPLVLLLDKNGKA